MTPRKRLSPGATLVARLAFRVEVDPTSGCWNWTGARDSNGYGRIRVSHLLRYTHIVAWEQFFLAVPEGLELDHLCRNTSCCNPVHLEPVTRLVNTQRAWAHRPRWAKPTRPDRSAVNYEPCTTRDYRLKHLSADLDERYFGGFRGRAACGAVAYSEGVVPRRAGRAPLAELPECGSCAKSVAS